MTFYELDEHLITLAAHDQMRVTYRAMLDHQFRPVRLWIDELTSDRKAIKATYEFGNLEDGLLKFEQLTSKTVLQ